MFLIIAMLLIFCYFANNVLGVCSVARQPQLGLRCCFSSKVSHQVLDLQNLLFLAISFNKTRRMCFGHLKNN